MNNEHDDVYDSSERYIRMSDYQDEEEFQDEMNDEEMWMRFYNENEDYFNQLSDEAYDAFLRGETEELTFDEEDE